INGTEYSGAFSIRTRMMHRPMNVTTAPAVMKPCPTCQPRLPRYDSEHGKLCGYPLELRKRRILVNRQMRPRTGRSFQVRLQHARTLVRGNLLQSHLLTTPVKKSCDVCTPVVKANPGSRVQSLIFDKDKYKDAKEAKAWANDHGFDAGKVDETSD